MNDTLLIIRREHRNLRALLASLTLLVEELDKGSPGLPAFREAVNAYVEFEKAHAMKEEREIFPLAEEFLQESDWRRVHEAFTAHEDPLFGDEPRQAFESLHKTIVNLMPAPYGIGPTLSERERSP